MMSLFKTASVFLFPALLSQVTVMVVVLVLIIAAVIFFIILIILWRKVSIKKVHVHVHSRESSVKK